jgi:hypothetical protein
MSNDNTRRAKDSVVSAFSSVAYPGDDNIVDPVPYYEPEREQIKRFLAGKDWKQITWLMLNDEYIGDSSAVLAFLSPYATIYYLPAFSLIALNNYREADLTTLSPFQCLFPIVDSRTSVRTVLDVKASLLTWDMLQAMQLTANVLVDQFGDDDLIELKKLLDDFIASRRQNSTR